VRLGLNAYECDSHARHACPGVVDLDRLGLVTSDFVIAIKAADHVRRDASQLSLAGEQPVSTVPRSISSR